MKYLMRIMNLFLPDCEEVSQLASREMDEPLSWLKRLGMRLHILFCVLCRRNAEQLRLIRNLIRVRTRSVDSVTGLGASLSADARRRIAQALERRDPDQPD